MTDEREAVERVMDAVFQYHDAGVRCGVGLTDSSDQDPIYWGHESDRRYAAIKELVSAELQAAYRAGQASMPCYHEGADCEARRERYRNMEPQPMRCGACGEDYDVRRRTAQCPHPGINMEALIPLCPSCKARAAEGRRKA